MRLSRKGLLLGASILAGLALWAASTEYRALRFAMLPLADRLQSVRTGENPRLSYSNRYRSAALLTCIEGQIGIAARLMPHQQQTALATSCLNDASQVLADTPTDARAHLAIAASQAILGDATRFNTALEKAHKTAANEGWLAQWRSDLTFANTAMLSPANSARLDADVALNLNDYTQRQTVAARYISTPPQRARILAVVERTDADIQQDFLKAIKRHSRTQEVRQ